MMSRQDRSPLVWPDPHAFMSRSKALGDNLIGSGLIGQNQSKRRSGRSTHPKLVGFLVALGPLVPGHWNPCEKPGPDKFRLFRA
jgi:hypothetical protein